jgi:hypothetical protein
VPQQGCEDPLLFFEAKMGPTNKQVCGTLHQQTDTGTEPRLVPSASYKIHTSFRAMETVQLKQHH